MPRARKPRSIAEEKTVDWSSALKSFRYLPLFFKDILKSSGRTFIVNFIFRILSAFTPIVILYVGKLLIDEIILQANAVDPNLKWVWIYLAIEFALVFFSNVVGTIISLTEGLIGDLYSNFSSIKIIKKTKEISIAQLEDPEVYDMLERARSQTVGRVSLMSNMLGQAQSLITITSLMAGLIYFEPILILILVVSIIPSFINQLKYSNKRYSISRSWTSERRELDYLRYIGANDSTAKEVKLFGLTDFLADRFKDLSDRYYEINKNLSVERASWGTLFTLLGTISYYGAYALIIFRAVSGIITIGDLTFLSGSFSRLRSSIEGLFSGLTRITESSLYLKDYFDFLSIENTIDTSAPLPIPTEVKEGLEVRNLTFAYPGSDDLVLKGINFKLNAGETMAFVGQNGAGKTTLIKLLLRFYEPTGGEILLDGININRFSVDEYQKLFGVIFQDFVKYEFKVNENIAVGNIDKILDKEAIQEAAERSLADEVIKNLDAEYDQQLGRRFAQGKELSGGQWQKIALARAYMKNAQILILDEPTSALDARAEYEAFQRFIALTKNKTSVIISHRFSTVRMADRILVLKDGFVSELGTHEELIANNDLYAELFNLQAQGYQ